jgi:response regulator of citrate/malate metabolism
MQLREYQNLYVKALDKAAYTGSAYATANMIPVGGLIQKFFNWVTSSIQDGQLKPTNGELAQSLLISTGIVKHLDQLFY